MAIRDQNVGLDFKKLGVIKDALLNPLTTALRNTLASTLGASHKGLVVWDTDLNSFYGWNGTAFVAPSSPQTGLTPKGNVAFNATEPGSPTIGDMYIFTNAGANTWATVGQTVQAGDFIWWDGSEWQYIQGNVISSSESVAGIVALAQQSEVNTGTDDLKAVTSLKLKTYLTGTYKAAKTYFNSSVTLVAETPLTINHALALQHRDAFVASFKVGNSQVDVDIDSTDTNNLTITSSVAATGTFMVVGL